MDGGEDYAVKDVTLATVAKSFPCLLTSQRLVRKKSTLVDFCSPNSRTALITQNPRQGIFCYVGGGEDYAVKGRKADGRQFVQCLRGRDAIVGI